MKRFVIISLCLAAFALLPIFAEAENNVDGASPSFNGSSYFGGMWLCAGDFAGGYGEYGFSLLRQEKNFVLKDCIDLGGGGISSGEAEGKSMGTAFIGDRIIIGGRTDLSDFTIRSYGHFGAGFGLFGSEGHKPFDAPYMILLEGGGGFELQYTESSSFVIEYGGMAAPFAGGDCSAWEKYSIMGPYLSIGCRGYL